MQNRLEARIAAELAAALASIPPISGLVVEELTVRIEPGPALRRAILVRVKPEAPYLPGELTARR
jgi:hypothetical protein